MGVIACSVKLIVPYCVVPEESVARVCKIKRSMWTESLQTLPLTFDKSRWAAGENTAASTRSSNHVRSKITDKRQNSARLSRPAARVAAAPAPAQVNNTNISNCAIFATRTPLISRRMVTPIKWSQTSIDIALHKTHVRNEVNVIVPISTRHRTILAGSSRPSVPSLLALLLS